MSVPLLDRPIVKRLLEAAEERVGVTVQPAREVKRLRLVEQEFGDFKMEAEDLAFHALDYFGGRPSELRPERRRRLAQRSRIALIQDPLAGAEAELLANFGFGKGLSRPTARNPRVQDIIDEAWSDAVNEQTLTGYMAQRKLSNELITAAEIFVVLYQKAGKVRVGRLDPDLVVNVVPDPENRLIPLFYAARERRYDWDYETDQPKFDDQTVQGRLQIKYWPHWRNVEDAVKDRESEDTAGEEQLELPPQEKIGAGGVYHLAINQTGEQLRGSPPWARSLRFMSAMNVLTEAHVTMAQAASTFIARRAMKGSPRQIEKQAENVLAAAGELGAGMLRGAAGWGVGGNAEPTTEPFTQPGVPGPFPPGSWWSEQMDSSKLEALNLNSGAGQMTQTAQIVRAPIAASSGFGQHYLGDASNANLASASTLELPATMRVGAWQEFFEQLYRWFTDRAIEAAVKAGRLGGAIAPDGEKPLADMRLHEAEDRQAMEDRTGKDLSYEFTMPFPGRRQLADVTTAVQVVGASMDPNGVNVALRRILLRFFFEQIGIDDVSRAIEECIPQDGMPGGIGPQQTTGNPPGKFAGAAGGARGGATGAGAGAGANDPGEGQQPYGAKSGTAAGGGSAGADGALEGLEWLPEGAHEPLGELQGATAKLFREIVSDPAVHAALGMSGNGDG